MTRLQGISAGECVDTDVEVRVSTRLANSFHATRSILQQNQRTPLQNLPFSFLQEPAQTVVSEARFYA